jgi:hypothetical protein
MVIPFSGCARSARIRPLVLRKAGATPSTASNGRNTLATYVYPVIGDLPVAEVDTAHVLKILEPIWRGKAETASRVRGASKPCSIARRRAGIEGENPARWRGHLAQILPARTRLSRGHHKAIAYEEVPGIRRALHKRKPWRRWRWSLRS